MTADALILLRHGRTASNADGRFQGQLDVGLDDVGVEQAEDSAALLAGLLAAQNAAGRVQLVSSDLARAYDTARPLAALLGLPIATDAGLRERSCGSWEGLMRDEIAAAHPEDFAAWLRGEDLAIGGGETIEAASLRAEASLRTHTQSLDGGTLVAVTHGAAGRGGLLRLLGLPATAFRVVGGLANAHWAQAGRRSSGWTLEGYNIGPLRLPPGSEG